VHRQAEPSCPGPAVLARSAAGREVSDWARTGNPGLRAIHATGKTNREGEPGPGAGYGWTPLTSTQTPGSTGCLRSPGTHEAPSFERDLSVPV